MTTINERLNEVFNSLGYSQTEIAKSLNVTPQYISKLKLHPDSVPSERLLDSVCRIYHVNPLWLRQGIGNMIEQPESRKVELARFFGDVLAEDNTFRERVLYAWSKFTDAEFELVIKCMEKFLASYNENKPDGQ